jgi:hypothetical protein
MRTYVLAKGMFWLYELTRQIFYKFTNRYFFQWRSEIVPGVDITYDHNFLRFSTIFGEKMAFFSETNAMIKFL